MHFETHGDIQNTTSVPQPSKTEIERHWTLFRKGRNKKFKLYFLLNL